jgi:hypothetical protein
METTFVFCYILQKRNPRLINKHLFLEKHAFDIYELPEESPVIFIYIVFMNRNE